MKKELGFHLMYCLFVCCINSRRYHPLTYTVADHWCLSLRREMGKRGRVGFPDELIKSSEIKVLHQRSNKGMQTTLFTFFLGASRAGLSFLGRHGLLAQTTPGVWTHQVYMYYVVITPYPMAGYPSGTN